MADHGNVIEIKSVNQWESILEQGAKEKKVIVVDFTATWCGPCKFMSPLFLEFSKRHTELIFVKVDVDLLQDVALEWQVQAMPTFLFIKDKEAFHRLIGANKDELEALLAKVSAATAAA